MLVAKGFNQEAGIIYQKRFVPVTMMPSIRILMSIAAIND